MAAVKRRKKRVRRERLPPLPDGRKRPVGRPPKYPWDQWFDGREWVLRQGKEFSLCTARRMAAVVYIIAERRGVKVRVNALPDGDVIVQRLPD